MPGEITLQANSQPFCDVLAELESLAEGSAQVAEIVLGLLKDGRELARLDADTTEGTLLITLKPSDFLLDGLATARAMKLKKSIPVQ
jgi:hypothetical protein